MLSEVSSMDAKLRARFHHRLCYGGVADMETLETPSLPLTEAAVDYFHDNMPGTEGLGRLDLGTASKLSGKTGVSPCSMVTSVLYAKRLRERNTQYLQSMSSSDIFFISMMMASKYLYDEGVEEEVFNDEWAEETGQEVEEVNQMETDFLDALDWRLFVRPEEFEDVLAALERRLALKEGLKRGWFTYTELAVLLDTRLLYSLWNQVGLDCSKLAAVLSTAYLASVASMIGSACVAANISGPLTTATMAALSMQPSSFLPGLVTVSTPDTMVLPTPHLNNQLMTTLPSDIVETNLSVSIAFNMSSEKRQFEPGEWGEKDLVFSPKRSAAIQPETSVSESSVASATVNEVDRDVVIPDPVDNTSASPSAKLARPSIFSLWFFDSLLSQIWSVQDMKPTEKHCHRSCVTCSKLPPSSRKNRSRTGAAENREQWKSCKSCCEQRCVSHSGHKAFGNPRPRSLQESEEKHCECERLKDHEVTNGNDAFKENDPRCNKRLCSPSSNNHADDYDDLACSDVSRFRVPNAETTLHPTYSHVGSAAVSTQVNCPSQETKGTAFLNRVLDFSLSSLLPTLSRCDTRTMFLGLPDSGLLVT